MTEKAACYLRVSTEDQTTENQRDEVLQLARARGFEPVEYVETASAAAKRRPVFERMMEDVRRGEVSAVVVWRLDRLHRSLPLMVRDVTELLRLNVRPLSVRETWLDAPTPARPLLIAIFGWLAEEERRVLSERTRAGVARARAEGKRIGRPRAPSTRLQLAAGRVRDGVSMTKAARSAGVSRRTLARYLADNAAA